LNPFKAGEPMQKTIEIIQHVTAIDRSTEEGRKHARQAVEKLCAHVGATEIQCKVILEVLFSAHSRPRITCTNARMLLGGITTATFYRWRRENRFGIGDTELIPVTERSNDMFLEELLTVMERRARK